jgi:hypothetical protein
MTGTRRRQAVTVTQAVTQVGGKRRGLIATFARLVLGGSLTFGGSLTVGLCVTLGIWSLGVSSSADAQTRRGRNVPVPTAPQPKEAAPMKRNRWSQPRWCRRMSRRATLL